MGRIQGSADELATHPSRVDYVKSPTLPCDGLPTVRPSPAVYPGFYSQPAFEMRLPTGRSSWDARKLASNGVDAQ